MPTRPPRRVPEKTPAHPALWLILYGGGAVLTTSAIASSFGGTVAGTVAGFLVLGGTLGYEMLSRMHEKSRTAVKLAELNQRHDELTREMAHARTDIDTLRNDLERTNQSIKDQAKKLATPVIPRPASVVRKAQETISRMTTQRPAAQPVQKQSQKQSTSFKDLQAMAATRRANDDTIDTTSAAPKFSPTVIAELLHHAVQHDRVETFAQPIVRLPSRRLAYLELYGRVRARAGVYLAADQYRHLAEEETLIAEVDHLLLTHALECVKADERREMETGYFINISSRALSAPGFMGELLGFIKNKRDLAPRLIFELQQAQFEALPPKYLAVIKALAQAGCRFSLDHVEKAQVDTAALESMNFRFLKIEAGRLMSLGSTEDGIKMVNRFKDRLEGAGISLIVERIETERDLREILDFEIDYGAGFLFGKPDLEIAYRPKKVA